MIPICEQRKILHNLLVTNREARLRTILVSSDPLDIVRLHLKIGEFVDEASVRTRTDRGRKTRLPNVPGD